MLELQRESSSHTVMGEGEIKLGKGEEWKVSMRKVYNKERSASHRAMAVILVTSILCACASNYSASDIIASIDKTIRFVCGVHSAIPQRDASAE